MHVWTIARRRTGYRSSRPLAALMIAFLTMLVLVGPANAQEREPMVRVAHLSPDAPNVDVYVNDRPIKALTDVPYKSISPYLPLTAGNQNVTIYRAGDVSEPVAEVELRSLESGVRYTVGIVGRVTDGSLAAQVYEDDIAIPAEDSARLRVVHAAPDVAEVDIGPGKERDLFVDLGFPNASSYAEVPAGTYAFGASLTGSDTGVFSVPGAVLEPETVYTVFAVGSAEDETLEALVATDSGDQNPATLEIVTFMPETGGIPLRLVIFSGVAVVASSIVFAKRRLLAL